MHCYPSSVFIGIQQKWTETKTRAVKQPDDIIWTVNPDMMMSSGGGILMEGLTKESQTLGCMLGNLVCAQTSVIQSIYSFQVERLKSEHVYSTFSTWQNEICFPGRHQNKLETIAHSNKSRKHSNIKWEVILYLHLDWVNGKSLFNSTEILSDAF